MIPEAHLYDDKARMYEPNSGRFLQTDPVGYAGDMNLYAYAANDPINGGDPTGLAYVEPLPIIKCENGRCISGRAHFSPW